MPKSLEVRRGGGKGGDVADEADPEGGCLQGEEMGVEKLELGKVLCIWVIQQGLQWAVKPAAPVE